MFLTLKELKKYHNLMETVNISFSLGFKERNYY